MAFCVANLHILGMAEMETISHNFYIINYIPSLAPHKVFENSFEYEIHIQIQIFAAPASPLGILAASEFNEVLNHNLHKRFAEPTAHRPSGKEPRPHSQRLPHRKFAFCAL